MEGAIYSSTTVRIPWLNPVRKKSIILGMRKLRKGYLERDSVWGSKRV